MSYKTEGFNTDFISNVNMDNFYEKALSLFYYQITNNKLYSAFAKALHISGNNTPSLTQIPFLPISFYKSHIVTIKELINPAIIFESSGTTVGNTSKHYVADELLYRYSLLQSFEQFYGNPSNYAILALLPSYLERTNASLVYMANVLMEASGHLLNGFYLNEWDKLATTITTLERQEQKTLVIGVTFALLDFAAQYPMALQNTIVMETGGMKGRREEWTREQVHSYLKQQWGLKDIHSEYGMTELLSQAYALANGIFFPTRTMKVLVRDINDPLDVKETGTGCLNIIDLANIHSCAFIATDDIGTVYPDGSFEVLGRIDHSALRGCNLLVV